jgi:hypothetical protein
MPSCWGKRNIECGWRVPFSGASTGILPRGRASAGHDLNIAAFNLIDCTTLKVETHSDGRRNVRALLLFVDY